MNPWIPVPEGDKATLYEVEGAATKVEPVVGYANLYSQPADSKGPVKDATIQRHIDEVLYEFEPGCTVLLFGSGHSVIANTYVERCPNIQQLYAMDMVPDAQTGLRTEIEFIAANIFEYEFESQYDYVFTTHTLEHFTREHLLETVIPKLRKIARKALVVLVPYADAWSGTPEHCLRFYENDEMAGLASRYKIIRDGQEIVYWIEGYHEDRS
jgi:hypothetical protein